VFLRRVIAIALVFESLLLLALVWFFWNVPGGVLPRMPEYENPEVLPTVAVLAYVGLLQPVIVYAWRGVLPASMLPRCLVIATALPVTLTQLVLPFAVDGGLADSTILWGFCVALGIAYMLNRDVLRPAPATEP
jgi:hypothetical protein